MLNAGQEVFLLQAVAAHTHAGRLSFARRDLNVVFDNDLDRSAHRFGQTGVLSAAGLQSLSEVGVLDLWRKCFPTTRD